MQGEISGLSRSVSNLGSSFGTAIAGTILVSELGSGNDSYVVAMIVLAGLALIGLVAAVLLPRTSAQQGVDRADAGGRSAGVHLLLEHAALIQREQQRQRRHHEEDGHAEEDEDDGERLARTRRRPRW